MLPQLGDAAAIGFGLGDTEHGEEGLACRHDGHVVFQHHQRIADGVHDALRHLQVAVAFLAGGALFADILDGQKNKAVMFAGAKNLARIDQHGAPPDGGEIMLDLEAFD